MSKARLYRSRSDRMIGGVCGGLGTYLNVDPTIIRLLFILLLFGSEFGFVLYLLLWILVPEEGIVYGEGDEEFTNRVKAMGDDIQQAVARPHPQAGLILGAGLVLVGGLMILNRLDIHWLKWLNFDILWPVILIIGGIAVLVRQITGEDE